MDILGTARRLEAALSERLDRAAGRVRQTGPREPLEVVHAVVDGVMRHVQPGGRGRYVFPYNRVKVTLAAATKDARVRLEAVLDDEPTLRDRVVERLASAGCSASDLDVRTVFVAGSQPEWQDPDFHLELHRLAERAPAAGRPGCRSSGGRLSRWAISSRVAQVVWSTATRMRWIS